MIIIVSILLVVSVAINIFLYKALNVSLTKVKIYEVWILDFKEMVQDTYAKLKFIDDREMFEKDDEVGFVFSNMVDIINDLKEKTYDDDDSKNKNKENSQE